VLFFDVVRGPFVHEVNPDPSSHPAVGVIQVTVMTQRSFPELDVAQVVGVIRRNRALIHLRCTASHRCFRRQLIFLKLSRSQPHKISRIQTQAFSAAATLIMNGFHSPAVCPFEIVPDSRTALHPRFGVRTQRLGQKDQENRLATRN
jgi:hypothetical protein